IADTDSGIYMETNRSWSIDDKRYNFQFGCEIGWEIKSGKRTRMLRNPSYSGITTEFWNAMDAICSRDEWVLWGTPHCGKGQPQQVMGTGHGAAPARFRNVKVGSAYKGNRQRITVARLAATGRPLAQQFTKRAAIFNWACDLLLSAQALSVKKLISPAANCSAGQHEPTKSEGWLRRGGPGITMREFNFSCTWDQETAST